MAVSPILSRSTRVGLSAMAALATASGSDAPALTAARIARQSHVPQPFLAKILTALSRHGLITGARGPGGGYVLARPPGQIALLDIVTCFERMEHAPLCPLGDGKQCMRKTPCPLHEPFRKLWETQAEFLARTTLAGFASPSGKRR